MKVDQSSKEMSRYMRNSSGNMGGKDSESRCELDLIRIGAKAGPGFGIVRRSQQAGVKVIGVRRVALVVSFLKMSFSRAACQRYGHLAPEHFE